MWYGARDPFEAAKLVLLVLFAVALLCGWLVVCARRGQVSLPTSPWTTVVLAFLVVAGAASAVGPPASSFFGWPTRQIGWLLYMAVGVIAVFAAGLSDWPTITELRRWTLGALVFLGSYGALQVVGLEPFPIDSQVSGVFVMLGNPNFAGAWGGSLFGLAIVAALDDGERRGWRILGALGATASALLVLGAGSIVGFVALGTSGSVVALLWLSRAEGRYRRIGLPVATTLTGAAALVTALGTFETGPLARLGQATGVVLRRFYWDAALAMGADRPFTGVGLEQFILHYRQYRSPGAADAVAVTVETDGAHSVPLQLLSGGGVPLLLVWLVLVVVTVWAAIRAWRAAEPGDALGVAALISVWAGVTTQSLASFDVPALLALAMVPAGLLAGLAWPGTTSLLLGSRLTSAKGRQRVTAPKWALPTAGATALVLVVGGVVIGSKPLRAEIAARDAAIALQAQDPNALAAAWEAATGVTPWVVDYPYRAGLAWLEFGDVDRAIDSFSAALAIQPDHVGSLVSRARAYNALGDRDAAEVDLLAALSAEPNHLDIKVEVGRFMVDRDHDLASRLAAEVRERDPDHPDLEPFEEILAEFG